MAPRRELTLMDRYPVIAAVSIMTNIAWIDEKMRMRCYRDLTAWAFILWRSATDAVALGESEQPLYHSSSMKGAMNY
jgi:hypothetical protein